GIGRETDGVTIIPGSTAVAMSLLLGGVEGETLPGWVVAKVMNPPLTLRAFPSGRGEFLTIRTGLRTTGMDACRYCFVARMVAQSRTFCGSAVCISRKLFLKTADLGRQGLRYTLLRLVFGLGRGCPPDCGRVRGIPPLHDDLKHPSYRYAF
ncbi:MAG: hypothetical protein U0V70_22265, partial [Terriglobia bacterium]